MRFPLLCFQLLSVRQYQLKGLGGKPLLWEDLLDRKTWMDCLISWLLNQRALLTIKWMISLHSNLGCTWWWPTSSSGELIISEGKQMKQRRYTGKAFKTSSTIGIWESHHRLSLIYVIAGTVFYKVCIKIFSVRDSSKRLKNENKNCYVHQQGFGKINYVTNIQ